MGRMGGEGRKRKGYSMKEGHSLQWLAGTLKTQLDTRKDYLAPSQKLSFVIKDQED